MQKIWHTSKNQNDADKRKIIHLLPVSVYCHQRWENVLLVLLSLIHCTAVDCTINRNCIHICGLEPKIEITFTNNYTQCILYHDYFCHSCSIYWKISTFIFSSEIQLALTSSYYFFKMPFIAIDIDIPLLWFGSASKFLQTKH